MPRSSHSPWPAKLMVTGLVALSVYGLAQLVTDGESARNATAQQDAPAKQTPTKLKAKQTNKQKAKGKAQREPLVIPDVPRDQLICFCLYTVHNHTLKLSAQLYPLQDGEAKSAQLHIARGDGDFELVKDQALNPDGWMATFRVEDWDDSQPARYRVTHAGGTSYEGIIRKSPIDKDEIVVGNLSCNSNTDRGPRADIVANLKHQDPDLLFFAGDQSYDHKEHYAAWLLFGRQFGEIIKDRPTVTIPDDHDVGHPNLWGAGGKQSLLPTGADGGYFMPVEYVQMVERAQTSHLPDPYDPAPIQRGIGVYYTSLNVGGIDFAIVEDRKWKSGPLGLVPQQGPRPDHINDPNYDRQSIDLPEAELLGPRQIKFLNAWGQDWTAAEMKVVLSQTIFAGGAHLHGQFDNRLLADLDSNGWPQHGRDEALCEMRRCFAFHMAGDQHLATVIHHGVNEWGDAGWSFCSPSIWNLYGRWWHPLEEPVNHDPKNALPFTGRYYDGFGNKITMHAYANPADGNHMGTGYGLVRFKKSTREITMECWPRFVDVSTPDAKMYAGWPITIGQEENYGRRPLAWLPKLEFAGQKYPVVQIIDEADGSVVYTLRIKGNSFRPKVFREGTYTIKVGERGNAQVHTGVQSADEDDKSVLQIEL